MKLLLLLLVMATTFCVMAALLSAAAVGIGFFLAAYVPGLQLAHGIIAGAVLASSTLYFFLRLVNAVFNYSNSDEDIYPDSDEDIQDEHSILLMPKNFPHQSQKKSKSKRKKK